MRTTRAKLRQKPKKKKQQPKARTKLSRYWDRFADGLLGSDSPLPVGKRLVSQLSFALGACATLGMLNTSARRGPARGASQRLTLEFGALAEEAVALVEDTASRFPGAHQESPKWNGPKAQRPGRRTR